MELRKELNKEKQIKEKAVDDAAYKWVESNIVLINEQIDRRTVKRLIDSISKFDEVFGQYKAKLPALGAQIDAAEEGLEKVITGRANDKKAGDMLKRLGYLYNTFSRFFSKDLPILLNSHLFFAAKKNPDVRLDVLQPKSGERYNPAAIRDSLRHSLEPSKDDMKFLRKIYKKKIPLVDSLALSNQLLQMSYNELQNLTNIGSVPIMDVEEKPEEQQTAPAEAVGESVDRNQKKELTKEALKKRYRKVIDFF